MSSFKGLFRGELYSVVDDSASTEHVDCHLVLFACVFSMNDDFFHVNIKTYDNRFMFIRYNGKQTCEDFKKHLGKKMKKHDKDLLDLAVLLWVNKTNKKLTSASGENVDLSFLEEELL